MKRNYKSIKNYAVFAAVLLGGANLNAQDFTIKQAQDFAVENFHQSVNAGLDIKKSQKKIWETTAIGLPQVSGSGSYRHAIDQELNFDGMDLNAPENAFMKIFGADNITQGKLDATQLLFDGSYIVGLQAAKTYLELSQNQKIKTDIEVRSNVTSSYYLVLVAGENINIIKNNLTNLEASIIETKALVAQGFLEETEIDQLELLAYNMKSSLQDAVQSEDVARKMLKLNMGIELSKAVVLKDSLQLILDKISIDALVAQKLDLVNNPDIKVLNTQRDLLALDLKRYKFERLPTLAAFYQVTATAYELDFKYKDAFWLDAQNIGLSLSVPIFSSGLQGAKIKQAKLELSKMDNTVNYFESAMMVQFDNAINNLNTKNSNYQNAQKSLNIAQKIYDRTVIKHNEGLASSFELTQIKNQLLQSQGGYVGALFEILNAKAELDKLQNKI
jgi:outer membrane protein TolC